jgi:glycosyltransferase involved in cell wall biosynthesis
MERIMKISVIVPVYNEEDLIKSCLDSLIKQNYPKKDYEIIVVNDGSTDKTKENVEEIIKEHKKVNIRLVNQKNRGRAVTRENGARLAKYGKLLFIDSRCTIEQGVLRSLKKINYTPMVGNNVIKQDTMFGRFNYLFRKPIYGKDLMAGNFEPFYITTKNFDESPRGTGILFIDKKFYFKFSIDNKDNPNCSDDTKFIRLLAENKKVLKHPSFKIYHTSRTSVGAHIVHTYNRGPKFVDYYFEPGRKYFPHIVLAMLFILASITVFFTFPKIFLWGIVGLLMLLVFISVCLSENFKDFFIFVVLLPLTVVAFLLGISKGILLKIGGFY